MRRALLLVMAVAVAVSLPIGCDAVLGQEAEKPNIILILTDDQESGSLAHMPRVKAELIEQGTTFKNGFVTDPLCCPSRASILRGQYVHNHGVKANVEPSAHDAFRDLGRENSTIATWLQDEGGYGTALIGKYMNAYDQLYVPPGWDYWFAGHGSGKYRNFNNNGTRVDYPDKSPSTDILAERLFAYLDGTEGNPRPFFLYLATHDPHTPATPPARYAGTFADEPLPKPPSFNERDVSDKPAWVRNRSLLSEAEIANMRDHYRKRLESLQAVDEMVGELVEKLAAQGKAGEHLHLLHLRQRLPYGSAQAPVGQDNPLRGGYKGALRRTRPRRPGWQDARSHGPEQRPRADVCRTRWGSRPLLRRRPIAPPALERHTSGPERLARQLPGGELRHPAQRA
jgi:N-acetylglucosamine-6-sulfatase